MHSDLKTKATTTMGSTHIDPRNTKMIDDYRATEDDDQTTQTEAALPVAMNLHNPIESENSRGKTIVGNGDSDVDSGGSVKNRSAPFSEHPRTFLGCPLFALAAAAAAKEESCKPDAGETSHSEELSSASSSQPESEILQDHPLPSKTSVKEKNKITVQSKKKFSFPFKKRNVFKTKLGDSRDEAQPVLNVRMVEATWRWNYQTLVKYHSIHGNSNVLRSDPNKQLSGWVKRQRNNLKDGKLSPCKILLLNKLDFVWNRIDGKWYEKYLRLVEYQKKFGHCDVITKFDRSLAEWTQRQRREYKNGLTTMTDERIKKLEALQGWSWGKLRFRKDGVGGADARDGVDAADTRADNLQWYEKYYQLVEYQKKFGNCDVTQGSEASLATWVQNQCREYKSANGTMEGERIKKLEALQGWSWELTKEDTKMVYSTATPRVDREINHHGAF